MTTLKNRYDFTLLLDVINGNPNGDPDRDNMPRTTDTQRGLITGECLKRKIRNAVAIAADVSKDPSLSIYVSDRAVLARTKQAAYDALGLTPVMAAPEEEPAADMDAPAPKKKGKITTKETDFDRIVRARDYMAARYFDVRGFGAVMASKGPDCGALRGAIQIGFGQSIDPVTIQEHALTRIAVETQEEADAHGGRNHTMGRKYTIPYGLYMVHGHVNAYDAQKNGFSEEDLQVFWTAMLNMFEYDRSAARGLMSVRKLLVFKHTSLLGNARANQLFDRVRVTRKPTVPVAQAFTDYDIAIDPMPAGVDLLDLT